MCYCSAATIGVRLGPAPPRYKAASTAARPAPTLLIEPSVAPAAAGSKRPRSAVTPDTATDKLLQAVAAKRTSQANFGQSQLAKAAAAVKVSDPSSSSAADAKPKPVTALLPTSASAALPKQSVKPPLSAPASSGNAVDVMGSLLGADATPVEAIGVPATTGNVELPDSDEDDDDDGPSSSSTAALLAQRETDAIRNSSIGSSLIAAVAQPPPSSAQFLSVPLAAGPKLQTPSQSNSTNAAFSSAPVYLKHPKCSSSAMPMPMRMPPVNLVTPAPPSARPVGTFADKQRQEREALTQQIRQGIRAGGLQLPPPQAPPPNPSLKAKAALSVVVDETGKRKPAVGPGKLVTKPARNRLAGLAGTTDAPMGTAEAKKLLQTQSKFAETAQIASVEAIMAGASRLERIEQMEEAMQKVTSRVVTRYFCVDCERWSHAAPRTCVAEQHNVQSKQKTEHAFKCQACGQRITHDAALCAKPCPKCASRQWKPTSIFKVIREPTTQVGPKLEVTGGPEIHSLRMA